MRELRAGLRDTLTIERRYFHKDGHLVWGQLTVSQVFDGDGARMISMIQDISERKRMETQLVKQAFHDELTGLANRVLFRDRLHHALERRNRGDHHVAVILLDLDGFKHVNDSLGHAAGDELLKVIGGALPTWCARAKASGKGRVRTFDPSMHTEAMQWLELETDPRTALDRKEFFLEFHPLVRRESGRVKGLEARIRRAHPTRGIVPPGGFVSIAEESGLITSIGRWVLMDVGRTATTWSHDDDFDAPSVSVNIAAKQLESDTLLNVVRLALGISGLDPRRLILELTESNVMREPEAVRVKLEALKELGVRLAIDDFGTGYSSLSYLQYFPVDELKIDRSLVRLIESSDRAAALVRTIVSLARSLSVEVVAEGIEDIGQERYLRSINCDIGQGDLYSRPLPVQDVEAFLARARRPHPFGPTAV